MAARKKIDINIEEIFSPTVEFENEGLEPSETLRERIKQPVVNSRTLENLAECVDNNIDRAMEMSRESRKKALNISNPK